MMVYVKISSILFLAITIFSKSFPSNHTLVIASYIATSDSYLIFKCQRTEMVVLLEGTQIASTIS